MALSRRRGSQAETESDTGSSGTGSSDTGPMLPTRKGPRSTIERGFVRLVATGGIVGIAVLLGEVLASNKVQGWIIGLVVGVVTLALAALLWSSRLL